MRFHGKEKSEILPCAKLNDNTVLGLTKVETVTKANYRDIIFKKCEDETCQIDDDTHKLECNHCKKQVHYACAGLPIYQLALFLQTEYRRFICSQCVTIPDYVKEIMSSKEITALVPHYEKEIAPPKEGNGCIEVVDIRASAAKPAHPNF